MADTSESACWAENGYALERARLEVKLAEEISELRAEIDADPPMLVAGSASCTIAMGISEAAVVSRLWLRVSSYLESEAENFAALLVFKNLPSSDAVSALRNHFDLILDAIRVTWKRELARMGIELTPDEWNWPTQPDITQAFELFLWGLQANPATAEWPGLFPITVNGRWYPPGTRIFEEDSPQCWFSDGAPARTGGATPLEPAIVDSTAEHVQPSIASNLERLRLEAGLSYRAVARILETDDYKSVSKHCKGIRVPEDFTLAKYAALFSRELKRNVTVRELISDSNQ